MMDIIGIMASTLMMRCFNYDATIAKHIQAGDEVSVLIMAEGLTSRDQSRNRDAHKQGLSELAATAKKANKVLGVDDVTLLDFPDNRMDSVDRLDIVKSAESFLEEKSPNIVYTHYRDDLNIDHRCINDAVITACRPQPGSIIEQLLFFEVQSSTEWQIPGSFSANWFVDVTNTVELKLEALEVYASEMRPFPHARSIQAVEHFAKWRGASIGVQAAEGCMLGRNLN